MSDLLADGDVSLLCSGVVGHGRKPIVDMKWVCLNKTSPPVTLVPRPRQQQELWVRLWLDRQRREFTRPEWTRWQLESRLVETSRRTAVIYFYTFFSHVTLELVQMQLNLEACEAIWEFWLFFERSKFGNVKKKKEEEEAASKLLLLLKRQRVLLIDLFSTDKLSQQCWCYRPGFMDRHLHLQIGNSGCLDYFFFRYEGKYEFT